MPADSGTAEAIAWCSSCRSRPAALTSARVNWVRTARIPQPMSTPTAAGMIAPTVGMTDPTVAPMPRCASGINARYGWMKGIRAVSHA